MCELWSWLTVVQDERGRSLRREEVGAAQGQLAERGGCGRRVAVAAGTPAPNRVAVHFVDEVVILVEWVGEKVRVNVAALIEVAD